MTSTLLFPQTCLSIYSSVGSSFLLSVQKVPISIRLEWVTLCVISDLNPKMDFIQNSSEKYTYLIRGIENQKNFQNCMMDFSKNSTFLIFRPNGTFLRKNWLFFSYQIKGSHCNPSLVAEMPLHVLTQLTQFFYRHSNGFTQF